MPITKNHHFLPDLEISDLREGFVIRRVKSGIWWELMLPCDCEGREADVRGNQGLGTGRKTLELCSGEENRDVLGLSGFRFGWKIFN